MPPSVGVGTAAFPSVTIVVSHRSGHVCLGEYLVNKGANGNKMSQAPRHGACTSFISRRSAQGHGAMSRSIHGAD